VVDVELNLAFCLKFILFWYVFSFTHFDVIRRILWQAHHLQTGLVFLANLDSESSEQEGGIFVTWVVTR
jgi:hypothetical protein